MDALFEKYFSPPFSDDELINLGDLQFGKINEWERSILSPFGKIISEEEWRTEGWNNSDLRFKNQPTQRQKDIIKDLESFFDDFGKGFFVLSAQEPYPSIENSPLYEPLFIPRFFNETLTCLIHFFIAGHQSPSIFHTTRRCFLHIGFDMTIYFLHKDPLVINTKMNVLKFNKID